MKLKIPFLLTIFLSVITNAFSQITPERFLIKGVLIDSITRKPADFVTITLKVEPNLPIKTAISKKDGTFNVEILQKGEYSVIFTSAGYNSKMLLVNLTDSATHELDLGSILITPQFHQLKAVSIEANKPLVRQGVDRITYDLQADPESKSNSVLGMMHKVPLLAVDADDNILLNGNSDYLVLINGKKSALVQHNLKEVLRSMPASTVQRIEVMTNPPAKYDAEGLGGIINVITKTKQNEGYNGTVNVNERTPAGGPGAGSSFTLRKGKFGMSMLGGASIHEVPKTQNTISRTTTGTPLTDLEQGGTVITNNHNGYLITSLSYEIDSLHLLTGQFNIHGVKIYSHNTQNSVLSGVGGILQEFSLEGNNRAYGNGLDAGLNYQLGFKSDKSKLLTFSYQFERDDNKQNNLVYVSNLVNFPSPDYQQLSTGIASEHTVQVDYVQHVKKISVEAGIKGIIRYNKSNFQYNNANFTTGQYVTDSALSNRYNNNQDVLAAYNTYELELNRWVFKAGYRLEKTFVNANFISSESLVKQNYLNILPSVNINRRFDNMSSLNLGLSQRLQRPGIYQLNPFIDRSNPDFQSTGNPNLRPSLSNIIELSYNKQKKAAFSIGVGYIFFNNLIGPVSTFDPTTQITLTKYENTGGVKALNSNAFFNYPLFRWWNLGLNANVRYAWINVSVDGGTYRNEGFMDNISVSNGFNLNKGWRLNADLMVTGRNISSPQGKVNAFASTSFSVNKNINKKLSFSAGINNPFTKFRNSREVIFSRDFKQISSNQNYFRSFTASLNYRFGKLNKDINRNRRQIRNDDTSKGGSML